MLFSSLPFLYYFLPVVLIGYFLAPRGWKNAVLLGASLTFYAWGEPKYLALLLIFTAVFYLAGRCMEAFPRWKGAALAAAIAIGAALLGIFKYADFLLGTLGLPKPGLALPMGISFYTFQCISYAADVYRGQVPAQRNLLNFGTYVSLFPQLVAGPIVRYADVARDLESRNHSMAEFSLGLRRFLIGLGKKVLLANQFGELTALFHASEDQSILFAWLYALGFALQIYFDFSGYSDMAIGLGRIFGFRFPENFDYPYLSGSITEFWRRWHMTLGGWFRDYVYIPMGGNRVSKPRWVLNILTVWMLTGLWHGANWNFVLWGLLFGLVLLAEKSLPWLKRLPRGLNHVYVMLIVTVSFVLFNANSLPQAGRDLAALFGGLPLTSVQAVYALRSFAVLLAVGVLGATPLPRRIGAKVAEKCPVLEPIVLTALLLLCTAYLVDGSFNPFLYFRF